MSPEETVRRVRRFLAPMGITRVANVTGLDDIGIPVVAVVRPNSRSLSVSQGKGVDLAAAKASGLMESIELYHAERIVNPLKLASLDELRYTHAVVDPALLPRSATSRFHPRLPLLWIEGHDLLRDGPVWVPYETVHANYTLPLPAGSGCFPMTSNGLASGNHPLEAVSHGICEVVERDATTLWHLAGPDGQKRTLLDLDSVDDADCRAALDRYERSGVEVGVWDTTTDVELAAFVCVVLDRSGKRVRPLYAAMGSGCHPARAIALLRALTEAAQSRVTYIAGARDDMYRSAYERYADPDALADLGTRLARPGRRRFQDVPSGELDTLDADVAWELDKLRAAGIEQVVAVDLTRPEFRIPVVRVVIPGLEGPADKVPGYVGGRRAQARAAARTVP